MTKDIGVILLAGGVGTRMGSETPKQFLLLKGKPIARYSFDLLTRTPGVAEVVVVCAAAYRHFFENIESSIPLTFALPGILRQDSVYNGLQAIKSNCSLICVHDAARPCISLPLIQRVTDAARAHGAATTGIPVKFTVKKSNPEGFVDHTPDRSLIWEIQTPQVIRKDWLVEGFSHAKHHQLTVTDDVSLVELLKYPVKLVEGCYRNIKITTPDDLLMTEQLMQE